MNKAQISLTGLIDADCGSWCMIGGPLLHLHRNYDSDVSSIHSNITDTIYEATEDPTTFTKLSMNVLN